MLVNLDNEFYERISALSEALEITPGEYLERQHDSNANLKGVLLTEKDEFVKFVKDYKHILDELFFLSDDSLQCLSTVDDSPEMKRVFSRLNTLVGEDVGFITKLYMVYKEKSLIN
ncbi:hypothetical protein [Carnobacterium inhibens]|uniref:hypothetical protein n=1 Tax=Carnobacterium inhibens TaxID=147709 RepID=UPI000553E97F|nr:hypothetical protein [Carnobacterium inhibens]